ncbi:MULTISPECIES: DUF1801 domain-containing protein [Pseudomonas]|uniref:DUF1801 domain-containing protein n=1 Tax=Pseudomonas TaxID=286 RepID=UPI0023612DEF|nr:MULTISPECIES: DUF1801 domain-containing protein [Pseudomonas]WJV25613.1 DUF1801 domain-containing protein [Pseudomonas chlororaphis]
MLSSSNEAVEALLADLALTRMTMLEIVQLVRVTVKGTAGTFSETVKYGGIMFSRVKPFCGVFAYQEHVAVEFAQGFAFTDPHGVLEGGGKYRRHIKLRSVADVCKKHLEHYVSQAVCTDVM